MQEATYIEDNGHTHNKLKKLKMTLGDIKTGLQQFDHGDWIKLNGRLTSSLQLMHMRRAKSLGFGVNIPNANGSVLIQNGTTLGSTTGSNLTTIEQHNLPNVQLGGSTSSEGDHTHGSNTAGHGFVARNPGGSACTIKADSVDDSTGEPNLLAGPRELVISSGGIHSHSLTIALNGGVTTTPIDMTPQSLSVNTFVYLGHF